MPIRIVNRVSTVSEVTHTHSPALELDIVKLQHVLYQEAVAAPYASRFA